MSVLTGACDAGSTTSAVASQISDTCCEAKDVETRYRPADDLALHWIVNAPDGPFARYNPWLPFLAAGLAPPPASALRDKASARRVRELALALALVTQPPRVVERAEVVMDAELASRVRPHRDGIRALVPRLRAAQEAGDSALYQRVAGEVVGHSNAMLAAYRAAAGSTGMKRALDRSIAEFFAGEHAHH